jgi:hypothetical protein
MWSNITDEDIARANADVDMGMGETGGAMGGMELPGLGSLSGPLAGQGQGAVPGSDINVGTKAPSLAPGSLAHLVADADCRFQSDNFPDGLTENDDGGILFDGGPGSGNFGHKGRPGLVGGSGDRGGGFVSGTSLARKIGEAGTAFANKKNVEIVCAEALARNQTTQKWYDKAKQEYDQASKHYESAKEQERIINAIREARMGSKRLPTKVIKHSEQVYAQVETMRGLGQKDGLEHAAVYTKDGVRKSSVHTGDDHSVKIEGDLLSALQGGAPGSLTFVHNHPRSSSFSLADLKAFAYFESAGSMTAIGHDGRLYTVTPGKGHIPGSQEAKNVVDAAIAKQNATIAMITKDAERGGYGKGWPFLDQKDTDFINKVFADVQTNMRFLAIDEAQWSYSEEQR